MYNIFRRIGEIVIPTVYSDALSYGEFLGKLTNKLREVVDWINNTKFVNTINGATGDVKLGTLHFSGYTNKSYDGSANVEVHIPTGTGAGEIAELTFTGASTGVYNGSEAMTINIPSGTVASVNGKTGTVMLNAEDVGAVGEEDLPKKLPNPQPLTLKKYGETITYDGSTPIEFEVYNESGGVTSVNGQTGEVILDANSVNAIPNTVNKLPNPYALIFEGAVSATYDGTEAVTVNIPGGGGGGGVTSVNGKTGAVKLNVTDIPGAAKTSDVPNRVVMTPITSGSVVGSGNIVTHDVEADMPSGGVYVVKCTYAPIDFTTPFMNFLAYDGWIALYNSNAYFSINLTFAKNNTSKYEIYRLDTERKYE